MHKPRRGFFHHQAFYEKGFSSPLRLGSPVKTRSHLPFPPLLFVSLLFPFFSLPDDDVPFPSLQPHPPAISPQGHADFPHRHRIGRQRTPAVRFREADRSQRRARLLEDA